MTPQSNDVSHADIYQAIGGLEAKVDGYAPRITKVEERVSATEAFQNKALGAIIATGACSAVLTTLLEFLFKK